MLQACTWDCGLHRPVPGYRIVAGLMPCISGPREEDEERCAAEGQSFPSRMARGRFDHLSVWNSFKTIATFHSGDTLTRITNDGGFACFSPPTWASIAGSVAPGSIAILEDRILKWNEILLWHSIGVASGVLLGAIRSFAQFHASKGGKEFKSAVEIGGTLQELSDSQLLVAGSRSSQDYDIEKDMKLSLSPLSLVIYPMSSLYV